jgi:hypothetical protein
MEPRTYWKLLLFVVRLDISSSCILYVCIPMEYRKRYKPLCFVHCFRFGGILFETLPQGIPRQRFMF